MVVDSIESELQRHDCKIKFDIEYMDTKRFNDRTHYKNLYVLLKNKARHRRYDVIIAVDNNALLFLLNHRDDIYPDVPIVFCCADDYHDDILQTRPVPTSIDAILAERSYVTGVMEAFDYESTIQVALKFHPSAKRVIVVNDGVNHNLYWPNLSRKQIADFARKFGERVEFVGFLLTESNLDRLLKEIDDRARQSVVLLVNNFVDDKGDLCFLKGKLAGFRKRCNVPIYAVSEEFVLRGYAVGGSINSSYLQARDATRMALRILHGESPKNIPIVRKSPCRYMFDYIQMTRFGISPSDLPAGSVVLNEPESFYYRYKTRIWLVSAVFTALTIILVILLLNILRRKRLENVLHLKNIAIESSINAIVFADLQGRLSYVNPSFLKLWGYDDESEVLGKPAVGFWLDEDKAAEVRKTVLDKGSWVGELTARTKDGSLFDVQLSTSLVRDKAGNHVCTMASFVDLTNRRRMEETLRQSEVKWRSLVENAPDIIMTVDRDGTIQFINRTLPGITVEQTIGTTVYDYILPPYHQTMRECIDRVFRTGTPGSYELAGTGPNGTTSWYQGRVGPIEHNRAVVAVTIIATDITDRKQAEDAMRQSESKYRTLIENLPQKVFLKDTNSVYLSCNENLARDFKINPKDIPGKTDYDFFPTEFAEKYRADDKSIIESAETKEIEEAYVQDGRQVFVRTVKTPVKDAKGRVIGILGIFWDITERKHAQEALQESERRYKALFEGGAEGIVVAEIETKKLRYANPAICRMLGYTQQEMTQMSVCDIHPKEDFNHDLSEFDPRAKGEKTFVPGVPCLRKNGTVMYADINSARVVIDARECNVGFFTDVTERKKAEEALRKGEEQYRVLCNNIPGMVYRANPDWSVRILSNSEAICGYSIDEINSQHLNWRDIIHPADKPGILEEAQKLQGRHAEIVQEYRVIDKTGNLRWVEDRKTSRFSPEGTYEGVDGVVFDITERKRAGDALKKARDELEIRVRERTADLGHAVEDLRAEITERERAENALREAEERFRTIFEDTVIGMYRTTPDGRILMANPALVKMLGYTSFDEMAHVNLEEEGFDLTSPRSVFKQRLQKYGKIVGLESVWKKRDGSPLFVCESAVAVSKDRDDILYYEGTVEDISERKKAEQKLLVYQERLRFLASELSLAEERLRRRLATDVHDHIGQNLAISKIKLDALRKSVSSTEIALSLEEIGQLLAETIESSRSLTFELSPPVLYELGLEAALEWLVRKAREQHGLAAEFKTDGRNKPLDHNVRVLLFQAVRELLVNVAKHAKARNVTVFTQRVADEIEVSIKDDGVGFNISKVGWRTDSSGGFGLFSIRERLGLIGGRLNIDSAPDHGTRVTLLAPINHKNQNGKEKAK